MSKIAVLVFNSPGRPVAGFPWDDLREIFSGCQWMAKVPNAVEILPNTWNAWVGHMSVTDDRWQTDRLATANSERECEFMLAKKQKQTRNVWSEYKLYYNCGFFCNWLFLLQTKEKSRSKKHITFLKRVQRLSVPLTCFLLRRTQRTGSHTLHMQQHTNTADIQHDLLLSQFPLNSLTSRPNKSW